MILRRSTRLTSSVTRRKLRIRARSCAGTWRCVGQDAGSRRMWERSAGRRKSRASLSRRVAALMGTSSQLMCSRNFGARRSLHRCCGARKQSWRRAEFAKCGWRRRRTMTAQSRSGEIAGTSHEDGCHITIRMAWTRLRCRKRWRGAHGRANEKTACDTRVFAVASKKRANQSCPGAELFSREALFASSHAGGIDLLLKFGMRGYAFGRVPPRRSRATAPARPVRHRGLPQQPRRVTCASSR